MTQAKRKPGQLRIVGGVFKRTVLPIPATRDDCRPTPDRVRETLFNWLGPRIVGAKCLDLFAGSGALGIEAASRGAGLVVLNELDRQVARSLSAQLERLADSRDPDSLAAANVLQLRVADARDALANYANRGETFDLIFLDPPFEQAWSEAILPVVRAALAADGMVYLETEARLTAELAAQTKFTVIRQGKAGAVYYHLLSAL